MRYARHITTLLLFLSLPMAVHAQSLIITLTPAAVTSSAGEIVFTGTLQNATSNTLSLDGIGFTFDGSAGTYLSDEQNGFGINRVFSDDTPGSLDAGKIYLGSIFGLNIAPSTPAGNYTGAVTITGTDSTGAGYSSSQNFRVTVKDAVAAPEPSSLAVMTVFLFMVASLVQYRRRNTLR